MFNSRIIDKAINSLNRKDIIILPELCPTVKSPKSKCRRCLDFCPANSIKIENNILIDEKCTECGICISACPNGVFNSGTKNDFSIISLAEDFLKNNSKKAVRFACEKSTKGDSDLIALKCLGRLTENILIALMLKEGSKVEIKFPDCKGCESEKGKSLFDEVRQLAIFILNSLGLKEERIQVLDEFSEFKKTKGKAKTGENLSRRKFFEKIKSRALFETTEVLNNLYKAENQENLPFTPSKKFHNHKRLHLVSLLKNFNHKEGIFSSDTFIPFATASIKETCIGCNVCDILCPTGAIKRVSDEGFIKIYFNEQMCTNCDLCKYVCLVKAIKIEKRLSLENLTEDKMVLLIKLKKKICERCKSEFVGNQETICPLCEKRRRNL
ncbi:MAG: hypothetical protein A2149_08835 [Candidatus Schekmanbacteria bacterium RBG_16_38_11]|uniref:4Fe-4S ferredoxin-type domain-containing protein n=1 Tax=Candidatus Schekmanbacteria bacterium RBG_16_38_11 TaxID=1817880 RepID=A0A1F7RPR5_9BACT|nr:MAG: hypothetical protein A2149_08835 [Candidatus Schekmanbacteria bacterium RBG_16_38_11]